MISINSILYIVGMILIGILLPTIVAFVWLRKTKQPITTVLIGALIFFGFAIVLETLPKLVLFQTNNPIGKFVMANSLLYGTLAALLAGLFEETGRFVAFKFLLKKQTKKETAITYGIGHGGFEAMYILVMSGIQYIVYAVMINAGQFDLLVEQLKAQAPEQVDAIMAIPEMLMTIGASSLVMSGMERVSAMMFHIACSILVFKAVHDTKKLWLYPFAILLHMLLDMVAALQLIGVITNLWLLEGCLFVFAAVVLGICVQAVYKKMEA